MAARPFFAGGPRNSPGDREAILAIVILSQLMVTRDFDQTSHVGEVTMAKLQAAARPAVRRPRGARRQLSFFATLVCLFPSNKMVRTLLLFSALLALLIAGSDAFSASRSPLFVSRNIRSTSGSRLASSSSAESPPPSPTADDLKSQLLDAISNLRALQERDGSFSIDFGVKGGEINATSRAPQKVDYYAISRDVGDAAERVMALTNELAAISPTDVPTQYLGDKENGDQVPLNGP